MTDQKPERKRLRNQGEYPPCKCGGDRFVYKTRGRVQYLVCASCEENSKEIKSGCTMHGTKEHSEPG